MGRLFQLAQTLWQRAEWSAPTSVYRILFPRLYALEEVALPLVQPYLPVSQLRGQGKGCPLTVTCVGLDYGRWYLKRVMFAQEPEEIPQAPVSARHLEKRLDAVTSDIVIVVGGERLVRQLPRRNALVSPLYLEHVLDIQGTLDQVEKRLLRSNSIYNDFRLFKKYNYVLAPSQDVRDLEMYYEAMYMPTMAKRHGEAAVIVSPEEAREHFRRGVLLLVKREDRIVAGGLCRARGDRLTLISVGVMNADERLMKEGVLGSFYILLIRWANQKGYNTLDMLGCPPFLSMGIFQFKRKWGTNGGMPPNLHKRIWLQVRRDNPAVRQFLSDNPCAVLDDKGDLYGLVFVDNSTPVTQEFQESLLRRYVTPGMKGLCISTVDEFVKGLDRVPSSAGTERREGNDSPVPSNIQLA